ncbi:unnamed protein product [Clonostachys byssicola]|uniref:Uncharacterized protein n=1 Tax=Clonostachys byssicola TaxID=160290 RepID=A0A9N9U7C8_9HYPO|nr:unnamed protein product [Clonostachys byssicola]
MPVTLQVARHGSKPVGQYVKTEHAGAQDVLHKLINSPAKPQGRGETGPILVAVLGQQTSFTDDKLKETPAQPQGRGETGPILVTGLGQQTSFTDEKLKEMSFSVQDHGLIRAAYYAYSYHHNLVLRPEDIWFAILTQFSFYVNANSEKLRSSFVAHEGKKGLVLRDRAQADMGLMCRNMTKLIDENIVDEKLREWILPSFTTTTINDEVVAAVIMMGTLQRHFQYVYDCSHCGIPRVTLLGELSDWEDIQRRIEKLTEYGEEPSRFCEMLRPILQYMILSFKTPEDREVVDFWSQIISHISGSGMNHLDGWLVVFCFWDEKGKCQVKEPRYHRLFASRGTPASKAPYNSVNFNDVPCGFVSCPLTYISPDKEVISVKLLAGLAGFELSKSLYESLPTAEVESNTAASEEENKSQSGVSGLYSKLKATGTAGEKLHQSTQGKSRISLIHNEKASPEADTIQPVAGWWMYKDAAGEDDGKSPSQFYQDKMANGWDGQVSTGYVQKDGKMRIKEELPRDNKRVRLYEGPRIE